MENDKKKFLTGVIVGIIACIGLFVILAFIVVSMYKIGFENGKNNNQVNTTNNTTNTNTATKSNTTYNGLLEDIEKEHIIADSKLKYIPGNEMLILTKSQIDEYMGQGYSNYYEFVAVNSDMSKMLYCFIIDKTTENDYTAEQYIQESLKSTSHSEITTQTIAGIEFSVVQLSHNEEGKNYVEDCYVYKYNNKLLCLDFWHLAEQENNLAQMLQAVE